MKEPVKTKLIFITGGVLSSLGKGVAAAAIGALGRSAFLIRSAEDASALGSTRVHAESSKQASAGTIVSQFRNERLPLRMRTAWKRTITAPAAWRALRGPNTNHGATSSAAWLSSTPASSCHLGRK